MSSQKWNNPSVGQWDAHLYDWEHSEKMSLSLQQRLQLWQVNIVWSEVETGQQSEDALELQLCNHGNINVSGKGSLRCKTQSCSAIELLNSWKAAFEPWLPRFSCLLICSNWPTPYQWSQNSWSTDELLIIEKKGREDGKFECLITYITLAYLNEVHNMLCS